LPTGIRNSVRSVKWFEFASQRALWPIPPFSPSAKFSRSRFAPRHRVFYAFGSLTGGVGAPILFGWIIGTDSKTALLIGYLVGAALMILGAVVEAFIGVDAERKSLEHVATPLSCKL
jgi:hypothetical protein